MSAFTPGKFIVGWGGGVTGPTTPSVGGPTCGHSVAYEEWRRGRGDYPKWEDFYDLVVTAHGGYNRVVAICPQPDASANARLFAASSALYRELKHLVSLLEPLEQSGSLNAPGLATLNGAREALAEAEGRS